MFKNIAGRKFEMQILPDALNSHRSELIAVYGRRLKKLRKKESQFRLSTDTKKSIYTVLVSTWGLNPNQYSRAIVTKNLTMKCLFA